MKTKIFVDGNCIICDLEISHYKRKAPSEFELVDISASDFHAEKFGLNARAVDRHMHAITPEGKLLTGVDAFLHIWSRIPAYLWAGRIVRTPGIYQLACIGYEIFARIRPWLPKRR